MVKIRVQLSIVWWLMPYLKLLTFFCWLHGTEPDWGKLERKVKAAVRSRIVST